MSGATDDPERALEGPGTSNDEKLQLAHILEHGESRKQDLTTFVKTGVDGFA